MIEVIVAYAPEKGDLFWERVRLAPASNVALAIRRSGVLQQFPNLPFPSITVGIYGQKVTLDTLVKAGDRIEIYRPLLIDPKAARLLRAHKNRR